MQAIYVYIVISVACAVFFSGIGVAFVSSSKVRFELNRNSQTLSNKILSVFYRHPNGFVLSMLTGYHVALVAYGILLATVVDACWPSELSDELAWRLLVQILVAVSGMLLVALLMPKALFKVNPDRTLKIYALPLFFCHVLLFPFARLALFFSGGLLRLLGTRLNRHVTGSALTKGDLDYFVRSGLEHAEHEDNVESEVRIFRNVLDFSTVKIRDCMVPRTEIQAVDRNTDVGVLRQAFIESGHSKLIVYDEDIDNVIGYIHSSEMFQHPQDWNAHIQPVPIVPETMSAQKLMQLFILQKKTLAVVVDEFGGTSGIVSLEDLVEEILGDIEDEHDTVSYIAQQVGDSEYLLSARLEIEKVNELFGLDLPVSEDYLTIGGLILHEYQSFPKLNETVAIGKFRFKIVKRTVTKIELVRLKVAD